ncbi:uncharacterized protein N7458_012672 [Penicillium daleae]|uniref:Uncharacterized protein n=1 Tax=Penicillium daleae TaxID=63821 RepID=A0AAD6FX82_9EURO|nr:uncharacterized protein N7458_012672 [Penicillium daleae]KAJ5433516.1 hypothetical protein N7458_012672 [Penicillium daleae]
MLQKKVKARRKKIYKEAKERARDDFFENIRNHIIDKNYQGNPLAFEPDTSYIQPERKGLADLEFKNRDINTINDIELIEDRIRSLELRLRLHGLYIPKALRKRVKFESASPIYTLQQSNLDILGRTRCKSISGPISFRKGFQRVASAMSLAVQKCCLRLHSTCYTKRTATKYSFRADRFNPAWFLDNWIL